VRQGALSEQNSKYLERPSNRSDQPGKMQENQWPRNPVLTLWQSKRICSDNAAGGLCDEAPRPQGCTEVSQEDHETLRPTAVNCNRPASVIPICDESNWQCCRSGVRSVAQQSGGEFTPAISTTRTSDAEIQGRKGHCQSKILNTWSGHRTVQIDPEKCRKINGREIRF
jgi:hypothetical protein